MKNWLLAAVYFMGGFALAAAFFTVAMCFGRAL